MSTNKMIWPVTDAQIDKDELEAMDGVDLSAGPLTVGKTLSLGSTGISAYSGHYASKEYVEQQINENGEPTVRIHGDLVIADVEGKNEINVTHVMKTLQERLLVLQPNFEAMEEYAALKDAYDQYKMLEKLLMDNNVKKD